MSSLQQQTQDHPAQAREKPALEESSRQLATITSKLKAELPPCDPPKTPPDMGPSWRRYLILLLFALNSGNKSYQWLQVPACSTKAMVLYQTDNYMINATSIIFMLAFILLSWPACYVIERMGMRRAVVLASLGTALGSTVKCFSCRPEGIWLLMSGQTLVALSEQLIFSLPSRLASIWYPDHQVSLCVALCVMGGQMGLAMGFLVPQWFLEGAETSAEIARGFQHMFYATAAESIAIFLVCLLLFDEAPSKPPGAARLKQLELEQRQREAQTGTTFVQQLGQLWLRISRMLFHKQLMLLATSYGIIVGVGYTIQTLLDQMLKSVWPQDDLVVGNTGFLIIVAGIFATPLWGRAMDRWHAFKSINLIIAIGALLSLSLLAYVMVYLHSTLGIYVAAALFGLFHTGYIVSGLEYAVELTYPAPELLTSSIMNLMPQIHSILFIFLGSYITDNHGILATNLFIIGLLILALIFLLATRESLQRQAAIAQIKGSPEQKRPAQTPA